MTPIIELQITQPDETTALIPGCHLINDTLAIYYEENNYFLLAAEKTIPLQNEVILKNEYCIINICLRTKQQPSNQLTTNQPTAIIDLFTQEPVSAEAQFDLAYKNTLAFLYDEDIHFTNNPIKTLPLENNKQSSLLNQYFQPPIAYIPATDNHIAMTTTEVNLDNSLIISNGNILRDLGWCLEHESGANINEYINFLQKPLNTNYGYGDDDG